MIVSHDASVFNKFFKTTTLVTFFYAGVYTYLFMLTPYLTSIGWDDWTKGLFFALFSAVGIIAAPVIGSISDSLGRFNVIVAGLGIEILALSGYIHLTSPTFLLIIRFISAIAFNAIVISGISRIHDISNDSNRSTNSGIYSSLISIAAILSPLLGGFIADSYGYTAVFQVGQTIMISILLSLAIYDRILFRKQKYFTRNKHHHKLAVKDLNPITHIRTMLQHPKLRKIGLLGMFINFSVPLFALVIPYLAIEVYAFSNTQLSLIILFRGAAMLLQFETGRIPAKIGNTLGIIGGIALRSVSLIVLFFSETFIMFCLGMFLMGLGGSLWNLSAQAEMSNIAEKLNMEGKVIGTFQGLSRIAITISFILSGIVLSLWQEYIFIAYIGLYVLGTILFAIPLYKSSKNTITAV